jgi:peptidylprolyl isomerase
MVQVKSGDTIKVHYTGKLDDGTVFDSSHERSPLEFTIGDERIIPGFEEALTGMKLNESKTVHIPSDKAYGPYYNELCMEVEKTQFPPHVNPELGQQLQIPRSDGQTVMFVVTHITEKTITLDANHPLAGKDLTFDLQVVEIN